MAKKILRVGVIGCGNISATYFRLAPLFGNFAITACADLNQELAEKRAAEFGITAMSVKALLAAPDIDIIVNLTIPAAHYDVSMAIIKAGKHVYSEKPLVLTLKEGQALLKAATAKKLKVCCAPDTFLGGSHQRARQMVDAGDIGKVTAGTAYVMSHGMEHWHPNPDFFFKPGGGPVLDMGPYYLTNLINLLGPVKRVAALTSMAAKTRVISSEPRKGQKITVKTPTNVQALLEFASGATVNFVASWDVWSHGHSHMELYGTEGSLFLPDPNFFGGQLLVAKRDALPQPVADWAHPLGVNNEESHEGPVANYRTIGLADLADAILKSRDPRCAITRALHVVEMMTSILQSGETGKFITLKTTCTKAKALGIDEAKGLMAV